MGMQPITLTTSDSVTLELAGAVSSDQPEFISSYIDTVDDTTNSTKGELNSTTPVTAVAAPASGTRLVYRIDVANIDTAAVTVIMKVAGGTGRTVRSRIIYTGKCTDVMSEDPYPNVSNGLVELTDAEVTQLKNIDTTTLTAAQWGLLSTISGLAVTDSNIIVGNGTTWAAESGDTARTSLGLGTGDSPTFTAVSTSAGAGTFKATTADGSTNGLLVQNNSGASVFYVKSNGQAVASEGVICYRSVAGNGAFSVLVTGDASYRMDCTAGGTISWGDGTAALDTNLYRSAANILKTDDTFEAAAINVNGNINMVGTYLTKTVNDSALVFQSGTTYNNGAGFFMYGKDHAQVGSFVAYYGDVDHATGAGIYRVLQSYNSTARDVFRCSAAANFLIGTTTEPATASRLVVKGSTADGSTDIICGQDSGGAERFAVDTDGGLSCVNLTASGATIVMANLPTSDPSVAGRLYTSSNVVMVSAG